MLQEILSRLAQEKNNPCITISLNTHRTHPDNTHDKALLKNLCKEAEDRLTKEFDKRMIIPLLEKLKQAKDDIDVNYNLESLHIFISKDTKEIIKSTWPSQSDRVFISNSFVIRPLIKAFNRSEEYFILLMSQSGVHLYEVLNDAVVDEINNDDFPFAENPYVLTNSKQISDPKKVDNVVREFLNQVDKALVIVHNQSGLRCVVICTEDNFSRLMQVADKPGVYIGYASINYNNTAKHFIVSQAWEIIKELQKQRRKEAISEMKEAVSQSKVHTDLQDVYRAAKEGRGDLLIISESYAQPVKFTGDFSFTLEEDANQPGVVDDITSDIAWEVLSKKGRIVFISKEEMNEFGNIALKIRF
jgi:hypothetical protein